MKSMKAYLHLLAGLGLSAALVLGASTATATPIVVTVDGNPYGAGDTFTIKWTQLVTPEGAEADADPATLAGELDFKVDSITAEKAIFDISATHTTDLSNTFYDGQNVYFTAFGFDTAPTLDGASITDEGDYFDGVSLTQNLPGYSVELCAFTGVTCQAAGKGGPSGVPAGSTDEFQLSLTGDFTGGLELSNFIVRHAGDLGSFTFPAVDNDNGTIIPPDITIPEPASLALLGLGLVALAGVTRRRRGLKADS